MPFPIIAGFMGGFWFKIIAGALIGAAVMAVPLYVLSLKSDIAELEAENVRNVAVIEGYVLAEKAWREKEAVMNDAFVREREAVARWMDISNRHRAERDDALREAGEIRLAVSKVKAAGQSLECPFGDAKPIREALNLWTARYLEKWPDTMEEVYGSG